MSTNVDTSSSTKTQATTLAEQIAQGLSLNNLTQLSQGLGTQNLMTQAAMGIPFNPANFSQLTRQQLGLPPSSVDATYGNGTAQQVINEYQNNQRPLDGIVQQALAEQDQFNQASQAYIQQQQQQYNAIAQNPVAQAMRGQVQQAATLQPLYAAQNQAAAQANLAQTQNFLNLLPSINQQQTAAAQGNLNQINQLAGPAVNGLGQNLSLAAQTQQNANANQTALENNLTNLINNGGVATPQQQAAINSVYQNQLNAARQQATTDLGLATQFTTDEVAGRRGLIGTPLADSFGQLQKQYMSNLGQLNSNLSAQAAAQSLNYPIQLGGLNVQQQYLTGQQQQWLPNAVTQAATPLFQPGSYQQFLGTGYDPTNALANLFGLQTGGGAGVNSAIQYQSPLLQSRLANTTTTGNTTTSGTIPALGAAGSLLGGAGAVGQGFSGTGGGGSTPSFNANGLPFQGTTATGGRVYGSPLSAFATG